MRNVQSTLFTLLVASSATYAETTLNLTQGVSPISHDVYELHMTVFWICVAMGIVVFGAMFYSMFYHRKSRGYKAAEFHSHPVLEITWTILPVLILVLMAIPSSKVLLNMNNNEKDDITIKVTGYQWKWHYEYLEDNVSFFSNLSTPLDQINNKSPKTANYLREVDKPLVVPIHKKIRFLITSNDVNHSWWVPDFAVKRDAISGFINEAWAKIDKPGTYRGQCAELCGINHAFMPIVVIATTEQGYKDWVAEQKGQVSQGAALINKNWTMQELMKQGEEVYGRICAACHQPGGVGLPPTFPALKGSKVATGPAEKHVETVMNGVSGTAMQAFKNQLTDVEIASVITYERNAFGNNVGTIIQPIQMKAFRDGKSITEALATKPSGVVTQAASAPPSPTTPAPATPAPTTPTPATPAPTTPAPVTPAPSNAEKTAQPTAPAASTPTTPTSNAQAPTAQATGQVDVAPVVQAQSATAPATGQLQPTPAAAPTGALSPEDELKAAMVRGEKVYLGTCAVCHQPAGTGMPPTFPALKNSPIATGPVIEHISRVMLGKSGTAMMAFKDQLNDQELADVITYERNAWGNNYGKVVKPEDIKAFRQPTPNNNVQGAK